MKWRLENGYSANYDQLALVEKVSGFQENKIENILEELSQPSLNFGTI